MYGFSFLYEYTSIPVHTLKKNNRADGNTFMYSCDPVKRNFVYFLSTKDFFFKNSNKNALSFALDY